MMPMCWYDNGLDPDPRGWTGGQYDAGWFIDTLHRALALENERKLFARWAR